MLLQFYLAEVHVDVFAGLLMELRAANLLCKVGDADSVTGVELLDQKIAAGLDYAVYLVHDCTVHHMNHTLLPHRDACCVCKLYQSVHYLNGRDRQRKILVEEKKLMRDGKKGSRKDFRDFVLTYFSQEGMHRLASLKQTRG